MTVLTVKELIDSRIGQWVTGVTVTIAFIMRFLLSDRGCITELNSSVLSFISQIIKCTTLFTITMKDGAVTANVSYRWRLCLLVSVCHCHPHVLY